MQKQGQIGFRKFKMIEFQIKYPVCKLSFLLLTGKFGTPSYKRIDAPASPEQKKAFKNLAPESVTAATLAGDPITAKLTRAPGNDASIGGLKVVSDGGWFAARPSGTENVYKLYAESFKDETHLDAIITQAQDILSQALNIG